MRHDYLGCRNCRRCSKKLAEALAPTVARLIEDARREDRERLAGVKRTAMLWACNCGGRAREPEARHEQWCATHSLRAVLHPEESR
jgi:hypothetical protein